MSMNVLYSTPFKMVRQTEPRYQHSTPSYYADIDGNDEVTSETMRFYSKFNSQTPPNYGIYNATAVSEPVLSFSELETLSEASRKAADRILTSDALPETFVKTAVSSLSNRGLMFPGNEIGVQFSQSGATLLVFDLEPKRL